MAILLIGLGILIVYLVVSGKWNDLRGAIFKPSTTTGSLQAEGRRAESVTTSTRRLLLCGAIAGPVFVFVVLLQDYIRPGVNPRTQDLSLLSLGDWGWIQTLNFIGAGVLNLLYAVGLRRRLRGGRSGMAAPVLIALYGLGLVLAGVFDDDPANGFPPGTVAPSELSWHATLHDLAGLVVFIALAGALVALGRAFLASKERAWSLYAIGSAALLLALFVGTGGTVWEARGLRLAVLVGWMAASIIAVWLSVPDPPRVQGYRIGKLNRPASSHA